MRFMNLLSVGVLLGLAACEGESKDADTDVGTEPDTETEETTTGDTFPDEPTGPWNPAYLGYDVEFGVDATGAIVSIESADYGTFPSAIYVTLLSEDYFNGATDEICTVTIEIANAVSVASAGANWATWDVDATMSTYQDGCAGAAELSGYPGESAGVLWSVLPYQLTVTTYDSYYFGAYLDPAYEDTFLSGGLSDGLFGDADGNPYVWPLVGQAFPLDESGVYIPEPYLSSEVQVGAGVAPGFYYLGMANLVFGVSL